VSGPDSVWPMPSFNFGVAIDGVPAGAVTEVSGLAMRIEADGVRPGNVVLKRGVFAGDLSWWRWFEDAAAGQTTQTITIDLLDEARASVCRWTLVGARPVKMTGPTLGAYSNEAAVEEIELACDRIVVSAPDDDGAPNRAGGEVR